MEAVEPEVVETPNLDDPESDVPALPVTITLKGNEWDVTPPASAAIVIDVMTVFRSHAVRTYGACIGICCPKVRRILQVGTIERAHYDVLAYGGAVVDALLKQGVSITEISDAGHVCMQEMGSLLPTPEEVEADKDFSRATL